MFGNAPELPYVPFAPSATELILPFTIEVSRPETVDGKALMMLTDTV